MYRGSGDKLATRHTKHCQRSIYTNGRRKSRVLTGWRGGKDCLYTSWPRVVGRKGRPIRNWERARLNLLRACRENGTRNPLFKATAMGGPFLPLCRRVSLHPPVHLFDRSPIYLPATKYIYIYETYQKQSHLFFFITFTSNLNLNPEMHLFHFSFSFLLLIKYINFF